LGAKYESHKTSIEGLDKETSPYPHRSKKRSNSVTVNPANSYGTQRNYNRAAGKRNKSATNHISIFSKGGRILET
jgi:hypothetical protein